MVKFNTAEVMARIEATDNNTEKPVRIVVIKPPKKKVRQTDTEFKIVAPSSQVTRAWQAFDRMKLERNKLASMWWKMIEDGATKQELKEHYQRIESYRPTLQKLFDDARHVERYGRLPVEEKKREVDAGETSIAALKYQRSGLVTKRYKLAKKIKLAEASNSPNLAQLRVDLDIINTLYRDINEQIKQQS